MNAQHLVRLPIRLPPLLRFGAEHGIHDPDTGLGYVLHAWLMALFGEHAPRPFRYLERRNEVLGYTSSNGAALLEHAQAFGPPLAWSALDDGGVASKPMPTAWRAGLRLRMDVLVCPVVRHGQDEKDVYLHALDRSRDEPPARATVYRQWFIERCSEALNIEQLELRGMQARAQLLRRARNGQNRLKAIERPQALFAADATVANGERFAELLARGIGRHRSFGFGMMLLAPVQ